MEKTIFALGYDIGAQLRLLLYALLVGAALGVLFDLFRISRAFLSAPLGGRVANFIGESVTFAVSFIEDIAFFIISAITVVLFCFQANRGNSRGFILVGMLFGFVLYLQTAGRLTRLVFGRISALMWRAVSILTRRVITPLCKAITSLFNKLYKLTIGRAMDAAHKKHLSLMAERESRRLIDLSVGMLTNNRGKES